MSSKTSDKNVGSIEDDVKILNNFCEFEDAVVLTDYALTLVQEAIINILAEREQMLKERDVANDSVIAHKFAVMQQQLEQKDKRIQELEEENKKLKAQHVSTRNEATNEEKAELYDVIDKTLDTLKKKEKPIWQQKMKTDKMSLEEALNSYRKIVIEDEKIVYHGKKIKSDINEQVVICNKNNQVLAMYGPDGNGYLKNIRGLW